MSVFGVVIVLGVASALALLLIVVARPAVRWGSASAALPGKPGRSDVGAVNFVWWASAIYAVVVVMTSVGGAVRTMLARTVNVDVGVEAFWLQLPAGATLEGVEAVRESGGFTTAELELRGLSETVRGLLAVADLVSGLMIATVAVLVALACRNLRRGTPFAPVLARAARRTAVVVLLGGLLAQVLRGFGQNAAGRAALDFSGATWSYAGYNARPDDIHAFVPTPAFAIEVSLWPIGLALVLGVLAVLMRAGSALENETKGPV